MEGYLGDIQPQQMNSLYPQQQPPGQPQQREQLFQQAPKPAIQSQAGAGHMSFPPHQQGGAGGMGSGMSPTMNTSMGPGMNPGMNPNMGGPSNMGPGMNPGMNVNPGGMNPNMPMNGPGIPMNMNGPGMGMAPGGQRPGMAGMRKQPMGMGSMRPAGAGPPRMLNGMAPGMPGQGAMGMGGVPGLSQGAMGGLGPGGPGAGGLGPAGAGGMGNMMSMGGGAGGMPSQPGMPNNMGPGVGAPSGMGAGGMGMGLNGMGGSGGPGLGGNGMPNGPNRQWQYPDGMKRTTPQLDEFSTPHIASQQHAQHGVGGPQHGVGGPGQMPHALGPQMQPGQAPPQPTAPSPVGGLPAHHPQHPGHPGHMGPGGPGHMQPGGTPRMATPSHPGGPHMPNPPAPSPHHMAGSPAHHPAHPHQPHLAGSPAHQNQMSSPRHMTSSSPAPGPGNRSNAPTPVPPRGASADPMGMRPDAMGRRDMSGEPTMMRMGEGIGPVIRGPDGSLRPENPMMVVRDGRLVGDGMMQPIDRTPSADGMGRPPGMAGPPNGMRQPEIGRLGADGMVRGPYGQPPPYGAQTGNFNPSAPPYVLHQTPAQQHQNMQIQRGAGAGGGVPRSGSVDEMPGLSTQMGLADDLDSMNMPPGGPGRPNRQSMPPAMPMMMNGGPRPMPGGMAPVSRRSTLISRPCALGLGVVRMLQMSHEMSQMGGLMMGDWLKFRDEYFTSSGKIAMTIFYNVEGRKYIVSPELIARFFLAIFESGVVKMSLGLSGATESAIHEPGREHHSNVETMSGVWRYELENGWVVEQNGPMKILMVAEPIPGDPQQFKLRIEDLTFTAPTTSFFFRPERLEGNRIQSHGAPMTPRISPGLAARKPEPNGGQGAGGMLEDGGNMEQEEMLMYENVSLPPMPFQKYGFPENVWRLLAMSACVHELGPIMQLDHALQGGPLAALDTYVDMEHTARHETGFEFDDLGGQFANFNSGFNPSAMSNSSPALAHAHPGMHNHPPGSIPTAGRPTPTPPPVRPPGAGGPPGPRLASNGAPLAGSGELPPLPSLAPGIPQGMPGMIMSQSPSLTHPMPPGQPGNAQGIKRKLGGPEQPPDPGAASGSQPPRAGMNAHRAAKMPPAGARKKAKTHTVG